jgi:two-component system, NarL family, invasion response regulator UvrY
MHNQSFPTHFKPFKPLTIMTNGNCVTHREAEFLKLACTEMTYKEIAGKMYLSARTIDGYRDSLFEKLEVRSRVGLVLYAIKHGIVRLELQ